MTRFCLTCTTRFEPRPQCGLIDFLRDNSQVRAEYRNGLLTSAPTGQRSMILPDNSESTVLPTNASISECSPRPAMPSSMIPAIS